MPNPFVWPPVSDSPVGPYARSLFGLPDGFISASVPIAGTYDLPGPTTADKIRIYSSFLAGCADWIATPTLGAVQARTIAAPTTTPANMLGAYVTTPGTVS